MTRAAAVLVLSTTWLVACDVALRFDVDAAIDGGNHVAAEAGSACEAGDDATCDASVPCTGDECVCSGPTSDCSGSCFNLKSDHNHCGTCDRACSNGEHCSSGECVTGNGKDAT